jgi:hypothetical protein
MSLKKASILHLDLYILAIMEADSLRLSMKNLALRLMRPFPFFSWIKYETTSSYSG